MQSPAESPANSPAELRALSTRLTHSQQYRLQHFSVSRSVDLHCHCLPGIDDGPRSMTESIALCRLFVRDGFTDIVATPHQLGRWDGANFPSQIRSSVAELQRELDAQQIPLQVHLGGEVRVDERIGKLLAEDGICTFADGKHYLLVELPPTGHFDPSIIVQQLEESGIRIVLAHAERYESLMSNHNAAADWLDAGAVLQINAGSLLGAFGKPSMDAAWDWLSSGWVSLVATDSHGTGSRRPRMNEAIDLIVRELDQAVAKTVCLENPLKVLLGDELPKL